MLDYDKPIVLITNDQRADFLYRALIRIGMDNLTGYVTDLDKLEASGMQLETLNQISSDELNENLFNYKIIDVRSYTEFDLAHIPSSINIHTGCLEKELEIVLSDEKIVVYCTSGDRSAIAASFLLKIGYKNVYNLSGGINSWAQSGYELEKQTKEEVTV